ncbi:MAG TPA: ATP-dependent RecD-like DNA helicase [Candidatus Babeliales bacterium]|nr:ATP-dependent RecD-like DNA helicase [Candidatus Babeliales bacterium]
MGNLEKISGTIENFLFQSPDTGFTVFKLRPQQVTAKFSKLSQSNSTQLILARGYLANLQPGQDVTLQGEWVNHSKFGRQFNVTNCTAILPTSILGLKKYLGSGLIKGIGESYASKIVDHLGLQTLEIIEHEPAQLLKVQGIGQARYQQIIASWQEQKEVSNIMVFLQERDISINYAIKIYKKYGQQAIAVLTENPYRLADEIWGIGFKIADQIAMKMGVPKDSAKRIAAGLLYAISSFNNQGHVYAELLELRKLTVELLELPQNPETEYLIKLSLHQLYESQKIKLISCQVPKLNQPTAPVKSLAQDQDQAQLPTQHFVALSQYYYSEKSLADRLLALKKAPSTLNLDFDQIYKKLNNLNSINLNSEQISAVIACLQNKISVVTGGPGTGKTTIIKELLNLLDQYSLIYKLAAPTGRAAKRITESTRRPASTLHRLLEFDFNSMQFNRNEQNCLQLDFLIIDEASMLDLFLAYSVLKALPTRAHVIFIGDIDQLPSVGAGNFLNDLIQSQIAAVSRLKEIFRQAQDSLIITNAHRINQGEFPVTNITSELTNSSANYIRSDFIFIKEQDPENLAAHLKNIYQKILPQYQISPDQSIVLSPMHKGSAGTQKINQDLQLILNSQNLNSNLQLTYGGTNYKIKDRVIQLRNNYDKAIFNGDIGTVTEIKAIDKTLFVQFDHRVIEYQQNELDELALAYAISIHKSQGSEYDAVVVPLFTQHYTLLQRNLIYTAITRAKKLCIFLGQTKAIAIGVNNKTDATRRTFLQQFLTTDLACR